MRSLILVILLFLSGFCVSLGEEFDKLEPAFSETKEFRKFLDQQLLPWKLDDEIHATQEIIDEFASLRVDKSLVGAAVKKLKQRLALLQLAKQGDHQASRMLHDEFGQLYEEFGTLFGSAQLLGITEQAYYDHLQQVQNRFKLFESLVNDE